MNRLRSYRWIEGVNQTQLGETLGISPQLVSAIESGRRSPTCDISRLGYAPSRIETAEMTEPLHRQRVSTLVTSTRRAKELLRVAGEAFLDLSHVLDGRNKNRLEPLGPIQSDADIVECATEVRVGILEKEESRPIKNLTDAAERRRHLPSTDSRTQRNRRHLLMGRGETKAPRDRAEHQRARRPVPPLTRTRDRAPHHAYKKDRYLRERSLQVRVGSAHTRRRLRRCDARAARTTRLHRTEERLGYIGSCARLQGTPTRLLGDRSYRSIQIQMSRWRKTEPASFDLKPGRLLPKLVRTHRGVLSCAQRLGLNPDHLREVTTWHPLRVV